MHSGRFDLGNGSDDRTGITLGKFNVEEFPQSRQPLFLRTEFLDYLDFAFDIPLDLPLQSQSPNNIGSRLIKNHLRAKHTLSEESSWALTGRKVHDLKILRPELKL